MGSLETMASMVLATRGGGEVEPGGKVRTITFSEGPPSPQKIIECKGCAAYPLFEDAGRRHSGDGVSDKKFAQATATCERLIRVGSCQVQANRDSR